MSEEQVAEVAEAEAPSEAISDFRASLPEDLREHSALAPIQDVENLAKAYVNASSMIGKDKVVIPGAASSEDDWAQVYEKLGRPDAADNYALEPGEGANEELVGWFKNTAHEIGLNNAQAQKLLSAYNEMSGSQNVDLEEVMVATQEQTIAELKTEFGGKYEDHINNAGALLNQFGSEGLSEMQMQDGSRLGDNPEFIKTIVSLADFISSKVSEDELVGMERTEGTMAPDDARSKLLEIERPDGPLWDRNHPQHNEYVQERSRLYGFIYTD